MKKVLMFLISLFLPVLLLAQVQEEKLKEVEVVGLHFKYLNALDMEDSPTVVKDLHKYVGNYDILESDVYDHEMDFYHYTFKIPQGRILAGYDGEGNLLWTVEKFRGVKLPKNVARTLAIEYPGWKFDKTFYTINYNEKDGAQKKYKVIISKDGKKKRVTLNPDTDVL